MMLIRKFRSAPFGRAPELGMFRSCLTAKLIDTMRGRLRENIEHGAN